MSETQQERRYNLAVLILEMYKGCNKTSSVSHNPAVLKNVVDSYFQDIERAKDFHHSEYADCYKQSAYTIKWITQLRPFSSTKVDLALVSQADLLVNEWVAWFMALIFLEIEPKKIKPEVFEHILYTTRYRDLSEGALLLICRLLKEQYAQK